MDRCFVKKGTQKTPLYRDVISDKNLILKRNPRIRKASQYQNALRNIVLSLNHIPDDHISIVNS